MSYIIILYKYYYYNTQLHTQFNTYYTQVVIHYRI